MTIQEKIEAGYGERLLGAVKWLSYYLDQSSQCSFEERAAELKSVLEQLDDLRDEIAEEIEDALYLADPDAAADRGAW